ncbi:MAG: D-alanyl-D-alanine carboxypeptidase/D-alanyl-D-alanine-endopeptidase [Chloroflexi bacterium]|nr:D-alanyl-D-alanine carboxypeptidase/D-alanyl-D-alanine-endopeptidase [Chloroflexota bacterium]
MSSTRPVARLVSLVALTLLVSSAPPFSGVDTLAAQVVNAQERVAPGDGPPAAVPAQVPTGATPGVSGGATGPATLSAALVAIENQPKYAPADWGYSVLDQTTGEVIAAQNADHLFDPGSTMKTYSVSTALRLYGSDYRFATPVYRAGTVSGDTLNGNLVLVGSGDLSFGLREQPDGTLYYENTPDLDQSYATVGLPGAVEPPGNPLAGLDELASKVRASGIAHVNGDVVVDDRLFTPYNGFPDGLISPIWVNENLISILVTPGSAAGQPASISWRPMTASYTVDNQATTVAGSETTSLEVTEPTPRHLVVRGTIGAGPTPTLVVKEITDPAAFARTAFIEALQRAGVSVTATPNGPNPIALLPPRDSYQPADKVGEHVSATLAQYANLIMKVSYNRGADLMACLSAVKVDSTDCTRGVAAEVDTFTGLGVSKTSAFPFDGAGSDDKGRSSPTALATFYQAVPQTAYGQTLFDALPVLGKSGTLANVLSNSPAAGHAQVKTGNRVVGTPADQLIVLGNSLAGYIQAKSGRQVTFMIAVGNVPISSVAEFLTVTDDQARMIEAIYQAL